MAEFSIDNCPNLAHLHKSNNETLTRQGKVNMESDQRAA